MMIRFKRLIISLLVISLVSTLNIVSLASGNVNSNGRGGGFTEGTNKTEIQAHKLFMYPENQGIRMYIVNSKGQAVTDMTDILVRYPFELDKWKDGMFGGGSRARYNEFKRFFGLMYEDTDNENKETNFVYLNGSKVTDVANTSLRSDGNKGYKATNPVIGGVHTRYMKLDDVSHKASGKATFVLDVPSSLMKTPSGTGFAGTGEELTTILATKNALGQPALADFINLKLKGKFVGIANGNSVFNRSNAVSNMFEYIDSADRDKANKSDNYTVFVEKKYKLVCEPLFYYVPEVIDFNRNETGLVDTDGKVSHNIAYVFYGTASSILGSVKSLMVRDMKDSPEEYGIDVESGKTPTNEQIDQALKGLALSPTWGTANLGITTYMLDREEVFSTGTIQRFYASPDINSEYYSLYKLTGGATEDISSQLGYGVLIFSSDEGIAETSTFDEESYGGSYEEAPAPKTTNDDGTYPPNYPSEGGGYIGANKDHKFNIVKFYREIDAKGNVKPIGWFSRTNTLHKINIVDEDDGGYEVTDWFTSPSTEIPSNKSTSYGTVKARSKVVKSGVGKDYVVVNPNENVNTLYVQLTRNLFDEEDADSATDIVLEEDELAHTYRLSDIRELVTVTYSIKSKRTVSRKSRDNNVWVEDDQYKIIVGNGYNYDKTNYIGYKGAFKPKEEDNTAEGTAETDTSQESRVVVPAQEIAQLTPNIVFSLYRDKVRDRVTLYPKYNTPAVRSELQNISIGSSSYTPQRRVNKSEGHGSYVGQFKAMLADKAGSKRKVVIGYDVTNKKTGETKDRFVNIHFNATPALSRYKDYYNTDVLTKYFLGDSNSGVTVPTKTPRGSFTIGNKTFSNFRRYDNTSETLSFYPFTRMRYNTVANEANKFAFVTSTNESDLATVTAVDSGVYMSKPNGYGIEVESSQWSTHIRGLDGLKSILGNRVVANKSLIPGGATVDLKSSNSSNTASEVWVGFKTYEVTMPSESRNAYKENSLDTTDSAKSKASTFAEEVKNSLSGYKVYKYANKGILEQRNFLVGATKVDSGGTFDGNRLSSDKKYYLRDNVTGSQSSSLNIIGEEPLDTSVYQVYMNGATNLLNGRFGRITVKKNGSLLKEGNLSAVLQVPELKDLDSKTNLLTNLTKALDNGVGSSDRSGMQWYYEGNEPLEVVVSSFAYQLGFGADSPVRSEVVDPKLSGKLENKSDLLNFNTSTIKEKARTIQYRLSAGSTTASGHGSGYMGNFNGMDVRIINMPEVFKSRLHYMSNNTVKDLS